MKECMIVGQVFRRARRLDVLFTYSRINGGRRPRPDFL